jgi:hypothetical protein
LSDDLFNFRKDDYKDYYINNLWKFLINTYLNHI